MTSKRRGKLRTIVYVDSFNLYYGCLKDTPERWLDLGALCERLLSRDSDIVGIKYFTARVKGRPGNPHVAQRQQVYLRALATVPNLTIHYGRFMTKTAVRRLAKDRKGKPAYAEVEITEEKGSDVNLASHLLIDGFRARYDLAVVISNDSDLKEPVRFVREDLDAPVGVLNPHGNRSFALSPRVLPRGSFYKPIRRAALRASQFPSQVPDAKGIIHKPRGW
ncbi:MAG TPA: NYN domain-containing protein [Solirubrobacteraceae bacterium]|nr:NYN domain-containing protein [Solirubrobacteraceae bacterium]